MAGTITKSHDNSGERSGTKRDLLVQYNKLVTDAGRFAPLYVTSTTTNNTSTTETDLATYTVPGGTLANTNDVIVATFFGTTTNNADTKTLKVYWNGVALQSLTMTASQAGRWIAQVIITKTGASTQNWFGQVYEQSAALAAGKGAIDTGTATATDTGGVIVKVTGTSGTGSNDIACVGAIVEYNPQGASLLAAQVGNLSGTAITA